MSESLSHKRLKNKAAGKKGETEKKIKSTKKRIDAVNSTTVTEIERCGNIAPAINRLKKFPNKKKVLQVPQNQIEKAAEIAKAKKVSLTIKNLGGTKSKRIK